MSGNGHRVGGEVVFAGLLQKPGATRDRWGPGSRGAGPTHGIPTLWNSSGCSRRLPVGSLNSFSTPLALHGKSAFAQFDRKIRRGEKSAWGVCVCPGCGGSVYLPTGSLGREFRGAAAPHTRLSASWRAESTLASESVNF